MGIENVEALTEEPPARETAQAERDRHDAEKAAEIKARQIRLGHIPNPDAVEDDEEDKPKQKSRAKAKKTETEEE